MFVFATKSYLLYVAHVPKLCSMCHACLWFSAKSPEIKCYADEATIALFFWFIHSFLLLGSFVENFLPSWLQNIFCLPILWPSEAQSVSSFSCSLLNSVSSRSMWWGRSDFHNMASVSLHHNSPWQGLFPFSLLENIFNLVSLHVSYVFSVLQIPALTICPLAAHTEHCEMNFLFLIPPLGSIHLLREFPLWSVTRFLITLRFYINRLLHWSQRRVWSNTADRLMLHAFCTAFAGKKSNAIPDWQPLIGLKDFLRN